MSAASPKMCLPDLRECTSPGSFVATRLNNVMYHILEVKRDGRKNVMLKQDVKVRVHKRID